MIIQTDKVYCQKQFLHAHWFVTTHIKISLAVNLTLEVTPLSRHQLAEIKIYVPELVDDKKHTSTQEICQL